MRKFYLKYQKFQTVSGKLSWSHYCEILSISDDKERAFYERECENSRWSVRELKRQISTSLYQRLLLSFGEINKKKVLREYDKKIKLIKKRGNFMEKVYFIGAGPGDPELITVKGQRIVKEADVIIYAGSLVPKEVINCHKDGAEIYNSASMSLDEVIDVTVKAVKAGKKVARVHTGDPAIYGAHREQMDMLDKYGIEYEVIPGVSSFLAAAAAIKKEFTLPNVSQTVICTRIEGKTAVPEKESLESLAEHRASMAIFLSVQMIDKVVKTLSTSYPLTTPVAVVQKASWPDQKIVFGTLETIEEKVKEAEINKTAQILVGDFLGNEYEKSKLYDKYFSHEYREGIKE